MNNSAGGFLRLCVRTGKRHVLARTILFAALVSAPTATFAASEQHQSGEAAYLQLCAPCHVDTVSGEGGGDDLAPTREAIGFMSSARVRTALATSPKSDYINALNPKTLEELIAFLVPSETPTTTERSNSRP